MKQSFKKIFTALAVVLFVLSPLLAALPAVKAQTVQSCTLAAYPASEGSVLWENNNPPLPSSGDAGTFGFPVGENITFDARPNTGDTFTGWYITDNANGEIIGESFSNPLSFEIVASSFTWTITADFAAAPAGTYQIAAYAGPDVLMTPTGVIEFYAGQSQTYVYSAMSGYQITSVVVDGSNAAISGSYSFNDISNDHTISVYASPISATDELMTFVNETGGGISWTDWGLGPVPPLNPNSGGNGEYGFPAGENLYVQAYPNTIAGYAFSHFSITAGSTTTTQTENPFELSVPTGGETVTAYFTYAPSTKYAVGMSTTKGGQFMFNDTTANTSGTLGIIDDSWTQNFTIGDRVTFTASPYNGWFFHGIYSTWGIASLGRIGVSDQPVVSLVINQAFNISAVFSLSDAKDDISVSVSPAPYGVVNANTTNFELTDGVAYTFTFNVTYLFSPVAVGQYNLSTTNVYTTLPAVFDTSEAADAAVGPALAFTVVSLPVIDLAHVPEGNFQQRVLNNEFLNGVFSVTVQGANVHTYDQYQGLEVTIFDAVYNTNFNSPEYVLHWENPEYTTAATSPTPSATTTPNPNAGPTGVLNFPWLSAALYGLGLGWLAVDLWTASAVILYGLIVLAALPLATTYVMRKRNSQAGYMAGLTIAIVIDRIAFSFPLYTILIVVMALIILLIVRS